MIGKRRGITLVEALMVMALFILISFALVGLYLQHGWLLTMGETQFASVANARSAINGIAPYVVQAARVVASQTVSSTLFTTGTSTLILELPALDGSGAVINQSFDYAVFYTSSNTLYRLLAPNPDSARPAELKSLATGLTDLLFSYDNAEAALIKKITVAVTSTAATGRLLQAYHQSAEFILRNY